MAQEIRSEPDAGFVTFSWPQVVPILGGVSWAGAAGAVLATYDDETIGAGGVRPGTEWLVAAGWLFLFAAVLSLVITPFVNGRPQAVWLQLLGSALGSILAIGVIAIFQPPLLDRGAGDLSTALVVTAAIAAGLEAVGVALRRIARRPTSGAPPKLH